MTHSYPNPEYQRSDHDPLAAERHGLVAQVGDIVLSHEVYGKAPVRELLEGAPEQQCPHLRNRLDLTLDLVDQRLSAMERTDPQPGQ